MQCSSFPALFPSTAFSSNFPLMMFLKAVCHKRVNMKKEDNHLPSYTSVFSQQPLFPLWSFFSTKLSNGIGVFLLGIWLDACKTSKSDQTHHVLLLFNNANLSSELNTARSVHEATMFGFSSKNKPFECTRLHQYFQLHLCLRHHRVEAFYWTVIRVTSSNHSFMIKAFWLGLIIQQLSTVLKLLKHTY